jgi:hypothetical protein
MGIRRGSISTLIIADGLVFNMDAANRASYPQTGINMFNTLNTSLSASLQDDGTSPLPQFDPSQGQGVINFDGVDDDAVTNTNFNAFTTNSWAIDVWIKVASGHSSYSCICGNGFPLQFYVLGDRLISWLSSTNNTGTYFLNSFASSYSITADTWHHVVFTRDINNYHYYIDGTLDNSSTSNSTVCATGTNTFHFGNLWSNNNTYNFEGDIGPLHIYNRALSANEVLHNYNALKGRFGL